MSRLTKRAICLLLTAWLVLCGFSAAAEEINLLVNGSFEEIGSNGLPVGWSTEQWINQTGYTVYDASGDAQEGSRSVVIHNLGMNDARYAQVVDVEPETLYRLSGYIKAADIMDSGWGANLSVEGVYSYTEGWFDSNDTWQYVELYGETGEDQYELTVFARLGGYSGESEGYAQFDNLSLCKVREVPGDGVADRWYHYSYTFDDDEEEDASDAEAAPFWPWLLALSAFYVLLALWAYQFFRSKQAELTVKRHMPAFVIAGLVLAFVLRYLIAVQVNGYQVDVNCFLAWGNTMANVGPTQFYQTTSFCDYPPAYVYVMGLSSAMANLFRGLFGGILPHALRQEIFVKLAPMLCDIAMAWCVYHFANERRMSRNQAGVLALLVAFNPVLIINSAAWCQIDSVLALLLVLVAWFAIKRKWRWLMPVFMLAVLVKPQALMLGFLGLAAIIIDWLRHEEDRKEMLIGVGLAALVAAVVVIPFGIHQSPLWIFEKYGETLSSYAYATVNTANLYYLTGHNWNAIANAADIWVPIVLALISAGWGICACLNLKAHGAKLFWAEAAMMSVFAVFFVVCAIIQPSWSIVGYGAMAMAFAVVLPLLIRSGKLEHLPLLGGILFLLLYVLGIKMHERYLFPAIMFFAMAFAVDRDWRILLLLVGCSCTMFVNEGIVLDNSIRLGSSMGHLNNDTLALNNLLSALNLLLVPAALWTGCDVCLTGRQAPAVTIRLVRRSSRPAALSTYHPDPSLHWKRLDTVLVLAVTLAYSVVAFWHLGSTKAPQTTWTSSTTVENVVLDLGEYHEDFSMLYFAQVSYSDFGVQVSEDGENWSDTYWAEMAEGQCFRWKYLMPCNSSGDGGHSFSSSNVYAGVQKLSGRYVRITSNQIGLRLNEVIFRETVSTVNDHGATVLSSGAAIPVKLVSRSGASEDSPNFSDPAALIDEQDTLEGEPCWYTGTYFDEIYHARTAYEHLHGEHAYETTHPPLGKVMMSWGVALLGMTPFGWRFMGALMGVLMLPGMYLLAKQLTKRTSCGLMAALILALDCMHYTQTRIATIDSFPVMFIIYSYFFMARFMQRDLMKEPLKKLLPDLALCGVMMGCGVASKWIGVYAGVGLAVLFFWTCGRHVRLSIEAMRLLHSDAQFTSEERTLLRFRADKVFKRLIQICLWCLLFFVAVPLAIYLLSYIPFIAPKHPTGLMDYLKKVWSAQETMLSYHSTPGLGMNHPFYSPWYEWPFNGKPMYYAMAYFMPAGMSMSIFCFTNPAVSLVGLGCLALIALYWAKRHVYRLDDSAMTIHALKDTWSIVPAFVLIGLLAQYLPWVLVPRGTYIYHYFASLPFLVLATVVVLKQVLESNRKVGYALMAIYAVVCLVMFVGFYPYASGMTTPVEWLNFMKQFLHVYYS